MAILNIDVNAGWNLHEVWKTFFTTLCFFFGLKSLMKPTNHCQPNRPWLTLLQDSRGAIPNVRGGAPWPLRHLHCTIGKNNAWFDSLLLLYAVPRTATASGGQHTRESPGECACRYTAVRSEIETFTSHCRNGMRASQRQKQHSTQRNRTMTELSNDCEGLSKVTMFSWHDQPRFTCWWRGLDRCPMYLYQPHAPHGRSAKGSGGTKTFRCSWTKWHSEKRCQWKIYFHWSDVMTKLPTS